MLLENQLLIRNHLKVKSHFYLEKQKKKHAVYQISPNYYFSIWQMKKVRHRSYNVFHSLGTKNATDKGIWKCSDSKQPEAFFFFNSHFFSGLSMKQEGTIQETKIVTIILAYLFIHLTLSQQLWTIVGQVRIWWLKMTFLSTRMISRKPWQRK